MRTPHADRAEVELVTVEEALALLHMSRWQLYKLLNSGALPSISFGKTRRIRLAALRDYLERLEREQVAEAAG